MILTDRLAETELEQVQHWRERVLEEAGYPLDDAVMLAHNAAVDLHRAVWLLEHGCPLKTALAILT